MPGPRRRRTMRGPPVQGSDGHAVRMRAARRRTRWRSRQPHPLTSHSVSSPPMWSGEADDAVVVALAAVDHAGLPASGVEEEVEVVSDQFHAGKGLVYGHRFGAVLLVSYDVPGVF